MKIGFDRFFAQDGGGILTVAADSLVNDFLDGVLLLLLLDVGCVTGHVDLEIGQKTGTNFGEDFKIFLTV